MNKRLLLHDILGKSKSKWRKRAVLRVRMIAVNGRVGDSPRAGSSFAQLSCGPHPHRDGNFTSLLQSSSSQQKAKAVIYAYMYDTSSLAARGSRSLINFRWGSSGS